MSAEEEEAQADYQVSVHLEEERAESRNREYERDEFLNGLTNSNWAELRGEDESAEYELGVHLEEERMKEGR